MKDGKSLTPLLLKIVSITMGCYQLLYTQVLLQDPEGHIITHLGAGLLVVLLALIVATDRKTEKISYWVGAACSVIITFYFLISLDAIMEFRSAIPNFADLFMGVLMLLLLLWLNWVVFGKIFPIITILAIVYLFFGKFLPPPFKVPDVGLVKLIQWITVEFEGGQGIYGNILQLSAIYLFLFIFFGGLLSAFGGTRFIIGLGQWVGSKLSAGPAMVALIGSSLLGTITGSTVANVTITGAFTIPLMKKSGYSPEQSGAIEAVASNGGQITPPVMGATAFILAGFANIPYMNIVLAAIIPAVLYYFCVFCYIQLTAKKRNLTVALEPVSTKKLLLDAPIFIVPMAILVILLNKGFSLPYVGFWSIVSIVVLGCLSNFRKDVSLDFKQVLNDIHKAVVTACQIAIICGLIGVVATCIKVSGLGVKLPILIEEISRGNLLIALFIAMISSILLGMGVPTAAAYMLVAIGAVPALIGMGVPLMTAHLFCFIYAAFSHITPPVAIGALVASKMARGNYWKTNWEALKAAFVAFLLPFLMVYAPIVVLQPGSGLPGNILTVTNIIVLVISAQMGLTGYCFLTLTAFYRVLFLMVALCSTVGIFSKMVLPTVLGLAGFATLLFLQKTAHKSLKTAAPQSEKIPEADSLC